ncbi:hypothetical protein EKO27_g5309 [Xylaria grammica]|uniref:Uncharacterized protein n=1 Tax=Xylaria grammica TaxID=363999 RepID=A0A439D5Y9_9PEZI|nr:hypothetical protein EKO27_g5309 [Xylaria grammica]
MSGVDSAAQVGELQIVDESDSTAVDPPQETLVDPKSTMYRTVGAAVHLGLSLLETPQGKEALVDIGRAVVAASGNHIYYDDPKNMVFWVERFLTQLRSTFPSVILSRRIGGEGAILRTDWDSGGLGMKDWHPKKAGALRLNKTIIENFVRAGEAITKNQQPLEAHITAYNNFMFIMGITIAHELVHSFVGYLSGSARPSTPENISRLPSRYNTSHERGTETGESGRAWEGLVFGGIVEAVEDPFNPLGAFQAGVLYSLDGNEQAREVDPSYIGQILQGGDPNDIDDLPDLMQDVRLSQLPSDLAQIARRNRSSPKTISEEKLEIYNTHPPSRTVREREFAIMIQAINDPRYLFVVP